MDSLDATALLLERVPSFAELDPAAREILGSHCQLKAFRPGQMVFIEGDLCWHICILEIGRVKFFRTNAQGREQILKVFDRPGDLFCLASAFSAGTYIVSAAATMATRLHLLRVDVVNRLAQDHPSLGLNLVSAAGEHMAHLVGLADDLSSKTAMGRLAKHLYDLAVSEGAGKGKEVRLPRDRLRTEELASILGTVRVHISRSFAALATAGAIDLTRSFVRIRDLEALKRTFETD